VLTLSPSIDLHQPALLHAVDAEPRALAGRGRALAAQLGEDRPQQVDRHEHIARQHRPLAAERVVDQQRADAHQLASRVEQRCAAVVGARRRREQRVVDAVLPVAGEDPPRDHARGAELRRRLAADDEQVVFGCDRARRAERRRGNVHRCQRLQQTKAGGEVVADDARRQVAAVALQQLHLVGFEDQVADGEYQAVGRDDDAGALAHAAERVVRLRVRHGQRLHADDGVGGALERLRLRFEFGGCRRSLANQQQPQRDEPQLHGAPPVGAACTLRHCAAMRVPSASVCRRGIGRARSE
jgi:hypothetical protein